MKLIITFFTNTLQPKIKPFILFTGKKKKKKKLASVKVKIYI